MSTSQLLSTWAGRWQHGKTRKASNFFLSVFLTPLFLFAQKKETTPSPAIHWQLDATVDGVKFYHAIVSCDGVKTVLLKFENPKPFPVAVSWKEKFTTQMESNAVGAKGLRTMVLPVGVTVPAGCSDLSNRTVIIRPEDVNPVYVADIRAFDFADITVERAK